MSFDRRRCGRETRWRKQERKWKRKAGGSRKRKGFPLQLFYYTQQVLNRQAEGDLDVNDDPEFEDLN